MTPYENAAHVVELWIFERNEVQMVASPLGVKEKIVNERGQR